MVSRLLEKVPVQSGLIDGCRSCGSRLLEPVLHLGRTPLANRLLDDAAAAEPAYPLELVFCPACSLAQITYTVPPEELFRDYVYFSSYSDTMLAHAAALAGRLARERRLGPNSLVVEVASNDGYLLKNYAAAGVPVLGVEPARNVAREAERAGVATVTEFFGRDLAESLAGRGTRADVVHAHNVLAHVADLNGVVAGFEAVLAPGGVAVVEVPYVAELVRHAEFDTVYHEHLCYFSLTALEGLFARHGLEVQNVEPLSIHGGSLRVFAGRPGEGTVSPRVAGLLREEQAAGLDEPRYYADFARRVGHLKRALVTLLSDLKGRGARIAAYGASAKGSTLMNYFGIDGRVIDFVVDRSPVKQGRLTPGNRLPIRPTDALLDDRPDYTLLLTWNFANEILEQQADYRRAGGRFIVPVPELRVI